ILNTTAANEIYTLSLHDALPIYKTKELQQFKEKIDAKETLIEKQKKQFEELQKEFSALKAAQGQQNLQNQSQNDKMTDITEELRSEEHTSELQSRENLVCRLLLE